MGRILLAVAYIMWIATLVGHWFVDNQLDTIYGMCLAIGLMLISNRMIEDAKES